MGSETQLNIKLTLEYDGSDFCGWQVQPGQRSVQGVLEKSIWRLTGEELRVTGSGRTDTGVHALGQVANFKTLSSIPPQRFKPALNGVLPDDIRVVDSCEVADAFHARYSAVSKTYQYHLVVSDYAPPLLRKRVWAVKYALEEEKMIKCLADLIGTHDFAAFSSTGSTATSTVRTVTNAQLITTSDSRFVVEVTGSGFLYNMVRIIAGGVVAIGAGIIPPDRFRTALRVGERSLLHVTAPPQGLYLVRVEYD